MNTPMTLLTPEVIRLAESLALPSSLAQVLHRRGYTTEIAAARFLNPDLDQLRSPDIFSQMPAALECLLTAVRLEQPIGIYADRDVDGLTGLAILVRTLRSLGGNVVWGSPHKGRGLERTVLESLIEKTRILILVDCGTGENESLAWLADKGVSVIVADHHRLTAERPPALAWIHPGVLAAGIDEVPAGCVMAFKLAQALLTAFLGHTEPARMDYFLYSHLDLVALGILADRVPLTGENRVLVTQGLLRLSQSRKTGLAALTRFFRLTPRRGPISVREATWRIIPMLNAAGRLGCPEITAELLLTEDPDIAHDCIDRLLALNTQRRHSQDQSLEKFEAVVLAQCQVDIDPVLVAMTKDLEPSVTGLAAQSLAQKYGKPVFLFVDQGDEAVGSARGVSGTDLFSWVQAHETLLVKFGGHQGAVGMTLRAQNFSLFSQALLKTAQNAAANPAPSMLESGVSQEASPTVEADLYVEDINDAWWVALYRLGPFGPGNPWPLFNLTGVERVVRPRKTKKAPRTLMLEKGTIQIAVDLIEGGCEAPEEFPADSAPWDGSERWDIVAHPFESGKKLERNRWKIRDLRRSHG